MKRLADWITKSPRTGQPLAIPCYQAPDGGVIVDALKAKPVSAPIPTRDAAARLNRMEKKMAGLRQRDEEIASGLLVPASGDPDPQFGERGERVASYDPDHYAFFKDARGVMHVHRRRRKDTRPAGRTDDADRSPFAVLDSEGTARDSHPRQIDRLQAAYDEFWARKA